MTTPATSGLLRRLRERGVIGDLAAARQLLGDEGSGWSPRQLWLLMHEGDWRQAGELAYESLARESISGNIRHRHAHDRRRDSDARAGDR